MSAHILYVRPKAFQWDYVQWAIFQNDALHQKSEEYVQIDQADFPKTITKVVVLFPIAQCSILQIHLPDVTGRHLQKAILYAGEEELAEDIEAFHSVQLKADAKKKEYTVAFIQHDCMKAIIEWATNHFHAIHYCAIDALCLPFTPGQASILFEEDSALVKFDESKALFIEKKNLKWAIRHLIKNENCKEFTITGKQNSQLEKFQQWLKNSFEIKDEQQKLQVILPDFSTTLHQLVQGFLSSPPINLLKAPYRIQSYAKNTLFQYKPALMFLLPITFVLLSTVWVETVYKNSQAYEIKQLSKKAYKKILPNTKKVSFKKIRSMMRKDRKHKTKTTDLSIMNTLDVLGMTLHSSQDFSSIHFQSFKFDRKSKLISAQVESKTADQLEILKKSLQQAEIQLNVTSMDSKKDKVSASVTLSHPTSK